MIEASAKTIGGVTARIVGADPKAPTRIPRDTTPDVPFRWSEFTLFTDPQPRLVPILMHEEDGEWWAECPRLPGVFSQASSREGLLRSMVEALSLAIEEYVASGQSIPWTELPADLPASSLAFVRVDG